MLFKNAIFATLAAVSVSAASICDNYTTALLANNTAANQMTLLTLLVNTVVIGNYTQPNTGVTVPGILAPGSFNGVNVSLAGFFSGAGATTNVNNQTATVNFLDDGGAAPLLANKPANGTSSKQYFLMTHLYQFFGQLLGCSQFPAYSGRNSMFEAHKFMNLNQNQIGYFITQVGLAAKSFGVTDADITTVATLLTNTFNKRCNAPAAVAGAPIGLQSICNGAACPLADNPQCGLYSTASAGFQMEKVSMVLGAAVLAMRLF